LRSRSKLAPAWRASYPDAQYQAAGATIIPDRKTLFSTADILIKIQKPSPEELELLREGSVLIGILQPLLNPDLVQRLAQKKITAFAMDMIPRITRAQPMDVLSSQSTVAGYKAVLLAAQYLPKFFPMLSTAAGTITPAKVFIIGAGVAGLQAIATARRLGAVVQAFDVRPAVKQEVESLGAKFVGLALEEAADKSGYAKELSEEHKQKERELIAQYVKDADVVITTALVPGKRAPLLITKEMVATMKPGSVIIDLAAEQGGNCELTQAGKEAVRQRRDHCGADQSPQHYELSCEPDVLAQHRELSQSLDYPLTPSPLSLTGERGRG
jgi:NAD(P) transhydrogenase subunit alpha